jgi:hypothetical protein
MDHQREEKTGELEELLDAMLSHLQLVLLKLLERLSHPLTEN